MLVYITYDTADVIIQSVIDVIDLKKMLTPKLCNILMILLFSATFIAPK